MKQSGKVISGIIMLIGIALAIMEILPAHGTSVDASAVQVIQVYTQGLFIMIGAYITGRLIQNFTS